jgi:hypothetical protein
MNLVDYTHQIAVWYFDIQGHCFFDIGYFMSAILGFMNAKDKYKFAFMSFICYVIFQFILDIMYRIH